MRRNKLLKACLPLLVSFSLVLGGASAVTADSSQKEITAVDISEEEITSSEIITEEELAELEQQEEAAEHAGDSTVSKDADKDAADSISEDGGSAADQIDSGAAENASPNDGNESDKEDQENPEKEAEEEEENADETPYEELLSSGNLIVVTVDSSSGSSSSEITEEAVEDLSDTQIEAIEEYIEDQGYEVTTAALLNAASEATVKTITFVNNGFISLAAEGYGSGYDAMFYVAASDYQGNGNAYCIDPAKQAPGHDSQGQSISYTTTVNDYSDSMLLKIMYYGFGGPEDISASYASTPTARHILTHMAATRRAAELGIPGAGDYTYGANSTAIAAADALYEAILAKEAILGTVSILTPVSGQQTIMLLASWSPVPKKISLNLKKSSRDPSISDGNSGYSLKGAVYGVYSDASLQNKVGTLTTKEDGTTDSLSLDAGTYYVKELSAPEGYLLDNTVYKAAGSAGETVTVEAEDQPSAASLDLLLQKVDAVTGTADKRLEGVEFSIRYYAGGTEGASNQADAEWTFRTDENGEIYLQESYLVSGDSLIRDRNGEIILPLGSITIQETKAPEGYELNDTLYTCEITQDKDGTASVKNLPTGNRAVKETPLTTDLSVKKTVSGSGGNKNTDFHFTLQLTSEKGIPLPETVSGVLKSGSKEKTEEVIQAVMDDNEETAVYSFTLQHGQTMTFKDLTVGLEYLVTETDGESQGYQVDSEQEQGVLEEEAVTVSFVNSREMIVPTGADSNIHSMTGLSVFSVLAVLGLISFRKAGYLRK